MSSNALSRPIPVLHYAPLNKGLGFTPEERRKLKLRGLIPPRVLPLDVLATNVLERLRAIKEPLDKYTFLQTIFDQDETLFFRTLMDNVTELMPIVYTPGVGAACINYSKIYTKTRGLFLSIHDRGHISEIVRSWPQREVRVIVVTDGERILGLGDLGCNGMGIPVGKLMLYTACAGVHPQHCLPVTIDVGTNNKRNLADPYYIGNQHKRVTGDEYDSFVDECLAALDATFGHPLIQFEDFGNHNAFRFLEHYRSRICTFNDDIQGTASVALAGILASGRISQRPLKNELFLFSGAGEAGLGIADLICAALQQDHGLDEATARSKCWFVDSKGLVVKSRLAKLAEHKKKFAHEHPPCRTLAEAVRLLKPTALIGVSGVHGVFTRAIIEDMSKFNDRPVVFALSNPTSHAECTAAEAYEYSNGRAIFASGSPFDPVEFKGKRFVPGQGNNSYIFPAVGFAVVSVRASRVSDDMFLVAAKALSDQVSQADLDVGLVYPPLAAIREVSLGVAEAVANQAFKEGVAQEQRPSSLRKFLLDRMYDPQHHAPRARL